MLSEGTILDMPRRASGRRALARCWEGALGRQVIDGTWQNTNINFKSLRFVVLYSKHLAEEVLDAQPLAPVLALLQGVLHSCRMVFKVIKAQRNSGSLDFTSHRTEMFTGYHNP